MCASEREAERKKEIEKERQRQKAKKRKTQTHTHMYVTSTRPLLICYENPDCFRTNLPRQVVMSEFL